SPNPELGQNIMTSFPMIVAEELDADWTKVKVVQAPLDTNKYERQQTGGSGAIPHSWKRLRNAGATARYMLIGAAAKRWNVAAEAMPGIIDVVTFKNNVAVVGKSTWEIMKARKALKIEYENEGNIESTADHDKLFADLLNSGNAEVHRKDGDVDAAIKNAAKT